MIFALGMSAAASDLVPVIANSGFEDGTAYWAWQVIGGAQVSFDVDKKDPHSGKQCIVFKNNSGLSPNVYGRFYAGVNVIPYTKYKLSCWVRGEDVAGGAGSSHVTDWNSYMLDFPTGTFSWKQVSTEFVTKPGQYSLTVGINITNKCKSLAVDDFKLEPIGGQIRADGITGIILVNPAISGHDTPVPICVLMDNSSQKATAIVASISLGGKELASKRSAIKQGENKVEWEWNTGKSPFGKYDCTVRVLDSDGALITSGSIGIDVADSPLFDELDRIDTRRVEFDSLYRQCKAKGINLDYITATKEMLDQFMPLAREDVRRSYEYRTKWAITDFNKSLDDAIATMQAYLKDPSLAPVTRRYTTGKVAIDGLSFIGNRIDSNGKKDRGPLFFCGYGHFTQVRQDIPRFPNYGVNIIQIEVGPSSTLTEENKVDLRNLEDIAKVLDDAAKHNVMVTVLLSPHYFPDWAMKKWPQLGKGGGGFFGYCVDDPAAKQVIEKFLRIAVPMLKDKPALHSFCLSNEPVFPNIANCDNTKQMWIDYLTRAHGDIATLNKRYGTRYASFADVPYTGDPQAYDWIIFDQQRFADWHKWMADLIHQMAPKVPVHAKVMSNELNAGAVNWATDQELFGNLLEINGNDCYWFPSGNADWPVDPWMMNTAYDMQRSFANKPIFNSENHIAPDGSNYYIAPENFRSALWQGAIRGQGATTIWVWEHAYDNSNGFIGSVMERPGCARAVGVTCLDLNRFADEVTALETAKAPVAVVYSMPSIIRHGTEHVNAILRTYYGLDFSGVKIDFITEKQLSEGKGGQYKALIFPEVETLTDATFEAIKAIPASTRLMFMGKCFVRNEYGKTRDSEAVKEVMDKGITISDGDPTGVIWPALRKQLGLVGALPVYSVVDAKTGEPIWGVEWRTAKVGKRTIINIINLRGKAYDVKILRHNAEIEAKDLFSLGGKEKVSTLKPLTPVLAEVE